MDALVDIMVEFGVPIGIFVVLPVMVVWLIMRHKTNETNKRTQIVLAAINANQDIDIEEFLKKFSFKQKTLNERLVALYIGSIFLAVGLAFLVGLFCIDLMGGAPPAILMILYLLSFILLFIGIAIIIVYRISMRMRAKELEETPTEE